MISNNCQSGSSLDVEKADDSFVSTYCYFVSALIKCNASSKLNSTFLVLPTLRRNLVGVAKVLNRITEAAL